LNGTNIAGRPVLQGDGQWILFQQKMIPGPPFVFGACLVALAMFVLTWLPSGQKHFRRGAGSSTRASLQGAFAPLIGGTGSTKELDSDDSNGMTEAGTTNASVTSFRRTTTTTVDCQPRELTVGIGRTGSGGLIVEHRLSGSV